MIRAQQLRLDANLSVTDLATEAGVSPKAIRRLEDKGEVGHISTAARLSAYWGVKSSELLMPALPPQERAA
jgi:transcriptional regulator with XRE-family HTH domain